MKFNYKSTPIPVACVVAVIKTPEIDELIFRRLATSKILRFAVDNKLILFDNRVDSILSFEYEAFTSDAGLGKELAIRVELVDPKNTFESQFISIGYKSLLGSNSRVLEEIQRLQNSKLINDSEEAKKLKAKILEVEQTIKGLQDQKTHISSINDDNFFIRSGKTFLNSFARNVHGPEYIPFPQRGIGGGKGVAMAVDEVNKNIQTATTLKESYEKDYIQQVAKDNKAFIDRVNNEIANLEKNCAPSIYFFFGMGSDEDAWAGPVQGTLSKIHYSIGQDGSARKLFLEYIPQDVLLDSKSDKFIFKGLGRVINTEVDIYQKIGELGYKPYPLHITITNLIRSFLAKSANINLNNVIVLLPDLSLALESKYNAELKAVEATMIDKDKTYSGSFFRTVYDYATFVAHEKLYSNLGFKISQPIKTKEDVPKGNVLLRLLDGGAFTHSLDIFREDFDELQILKEISNIQFTKSVSLNLQDHEGFEDVIGKLITMLRENSSTYFSTINYFWETDLGVIEIIRKYNPTISLDGGPLLIFGDTNFILNFFYGQIELLKLEDTKEVLLSQLASSDRTIFTSDLRKHISSYISENHLTNGPFDATFSELPDEYAFKDTESVNTKNIPIFKYGYKNSNIIDFNINYDSYLLQYMQGAIVPSLKDTASITTINSESTQKILDKFKVLQTGAISEKRLQEIISMLKTVSLTGNDKTDIRQLGDEILRDFPFLGKDLSKEFATQFITALKELSNGRTHTRNYLTNEYVVNSVVNRTIQLIDKLNRLALIGNIKTLPLFKFHKIAHALQHPSYVFIREPTVLGVKPSIINQLFSGKWNIIGFKHHISEYDCYSSFSILKIPYDTDQSFTKIKNENTIS